MNKRVPNFLKFLFFFCLGVLLVWLSVRGLTEENKQQLRSAFSGADYTWVILSMIVGLFSHLIRALRWKMLMQPLGHNPKLSNAFFALMVGYMANYAVNRLEFVSRPGILARYEKIPFAESLGTVIVERLVDTLCFLLLVVIVFFVQFGILYDFLFHQFIPKLEEKFSTHQTLLIIAGALLAVFILVLIVFRKKIRAMMSQRVKKTWDGFKDGFTAVRKLRSPGWFIFHSFFIWFIYYAMLHLCFLCLTETAGLSAGCALTTLLFGTLAVIITPGGLGAYPPAVAGILLLYQVSYGTGTAIGWLIWLSQFVAIMALGLLSLILLPLMNKEDASPAKTH